MKLFSGFWLRRESITFLCLIAAAAVCGVYLSEQHETESKQTIYSQDEVTLRVEREEKAHKTRLRTVDLNDGIDEKEAAIIVDCYFFRFIGCGGWRAINDDGEKWTVDCAIGAGAAPVNGFRIDKRTGKIQSPIGPSMDNPKDIFTIGDDKW